MKKRFAVCLALALSVSLFAGCKTTATQNEETVLVTFNTEGVGDIAATNDGSEPVIDSEAPSQSYAFKTPVGSEMKAIAKAGETYQFVKWTKNGADYSTDEAISFKAEEEAAFIAVFKMDTGFDRDPVTDIADAKTVGDVLALPSFGEGWIVGEDMKGTYAFAFELNGTKYRVIADLDEETTASMMALDFSDSEYNKKKNDLIKDLPIAKVENLTEGMPSQAELDALVGKSGKELLDDGWLIDGYYKEDKVLLMEHGPYTFEVKYDGTPDGDPVEDENAIANLTVTSAECTGIGDALGGLD